LSLAQQSLWYLFLVFVISLEVCCCVTPLARDSYAFRGNATRATNASTCAWETKQLRKGEMNSLAVPPIPLGPKQWNVKGKAQRKESAAQAYVTLCKQGPTRGPTMLKWHYKRQKASYNPPASGRLTQSQQKESPFASFCRRATRTTLSFPCCSFRLRLQQISHLYDFSSFVTTTHTCACTHAPTSAEGECGITALGCEM